jgi:multiple RNA-binding domain-containing protein 1
MGISKSELLAGDDGNAAVKLALAETTVIAETKKYFEDAGIVLESLSPRVPRSQTVILVKNIPYGTTVHTLTDLFSPHGDLKRILLPPSGTLGVVEFTHSHEAGKAFKAVAYRRLGNAVLYLEKGPEGMFKDPNVPSLKEKAAEEKRLLAEKVAEAAATAASSRDQPDPLPQESLLCDHLGSPRLCSVQPCWILICPSSDQTGSETRGRKTINGLRLCRVQDKGCGPACAWRSAGLRD